MFSWKASQQKRVILCLTFEQEKDHKGRCWGEQGRIYGSQSGGSGWMVDTASVGMRSQKRSSVFWMWNERVCCQMTWDEKVRRFQWEWGSWRFQPGHLKPDVLIGSEEHRAADLNGYTRGCIFYTYSNSWTYVDKTAGYTRLSFSKEVWIVDKNVGGISIQMSVFVNQESGWNHLGSRKTKR